jgi:hypothetical protein
MHLRLQDENEGVPKYYCGNSYLNVVITKGILLGVHKIGYICTMNYSTAEFNRPDRNAASQTCRLFNKGDLIHRELYSFRSCTERVLTK